MSTDQADAVEEQTLEDLIDQSTEEVEEIEGDDHESEAPDDVDGDEPDDEDIQSDEDEPTKDEPQTIRVKLKGDDGEEIEEELTPDELSASVMRHRDYTQKTQALSAREREAVQVVQERYAQTLEQGQAFIDDHMRIIDAAMGTLSGEHLETLKAQDQMAWAEAVERRSTLDQVRNRLNESRSALQQQQAQMIEQQRQEMAQRTWQTLEAEQITRADVEKAFADHAKHYGAFGKVDYGQILDPVSVMTIRDAVAYRQLKAEGVKATKQVKETPKLPKGRKAPRNERRNKALDGKFKSGSANTRDLASWLELNS